MKYDEYFRLEPVIDLTDGAQVGYMARSVNRAVDTDFSPGSSLLSDISNDSEVLLNHAFSGVLPAGGRIHTRISVWSLASGKNKIEKRALPEGVFRVVELLQPELISDFTARQQYNLSKNLAMLTSRGDEIWVSGITGDHLDDCKNIPVKLGGIKFHRNILAHGTWYLHDLQIKCKEYATATLIDGIDDEDSYLRARMSGARFGQGKLWSDRTLFYREGNGLSAALSAE